MNKISIEDFAKQYGVREEDVTEFLRKKTDDAKRKTRHDEIQNGLRPLVEKYKNKFIIVDNNIIRITDIISEFGKFVVRGVGFNQFETWSGLNTYTIDKYHFSIPLNTIEHEIEDVDEYLGDRILSQGSATLHIHNYLETLNSHLNNTFFNEEYIPDFSEW